MSDKEISIKLVQVNRYSIRLGVKRNDSNYLRKMQQ